MSIHVGDQALIKDIRWENIRLEDARMNARVQEDNLFLDLWVGTAVWTQDAERGKIQGVSLKNVSVLAGRMAFPYRLPAVEFR